jgi:AcrR family transcriptional regulator
VVVVEMGRRERKKVATRRALTSAALRLAAERGFDRMTVEDISEAADVAPRTFFNYFSSKEDAVLGDVAGHQALLTSLVIERPAGETPLQAVHGALRDLAAHMIERREELLLRQQVIERHPALLARQLATYGSFERVLAAALGERLGVDPKRDLYCRVVAGAAAAAGRAAVSLWAADGGRAALTDLFDEAFAHLDARLAEPSP